MDLVKLKDIAIRAALAGGKVIQKYMNDDVSVEYKDGGTSYASQVVTTVDKECEAVILSNLLPSCKEFDLALLTEETEDDGSRFVKDYFWCIDPMDGTLPFIHRHPGFSVSIALMAKDGTPHIGVIYDPSTDSLYHAIKGKGAFKNDEPIEINRSSDRLRFFTDKRLNATDRSTEIESLLNRIVKKLNLNGFIEISGAGAVMNAIHVLENGPACMFKFPKKEKGGGSLWDFAATACIYHELDLQATNFKGGRLELNRSDDTYMNHEGVFFANY